MQQRQKNARLACALGIVGSCLAMLACGAESEAAAVGEDALGQATLGETNEALVACQGASCDGLLPANSNCKRDMLSSGVGASIVNASGATIGAISLFRSPSCQTVWATTAFYVAGGPRNVRVCAVRRRAADNDSSCQDYVASFGNDSPMKFANAGKVVFGRTVLGDIATRTPDFVVP